ncbi:MAG TPA: phosphoribosyltransferase [Candidatus Paceibacterota bacterium]|nr:phosphoribosyltransferase [Candidatus Paceibacterota bacterium]
MEQLPTHAPRPPLERRLSPSIAQLEAPIRKILEELREPIERGDYGTIIGDDASGRIPTRIIGEVINAVYDAHGRPHPDIRFLAGSGRGMKLLARKHKESRLEEYLRSLSRARVLIVTDTLATGGSLLPLANALRKSRIPFDIAAVGALLDVTPLPELERKLGGRIVYGMLNTPQIYERKEKRGVYKEPEEIFSRPGGYTRLVNEARADAHVVAQHLIEKFSPHG